MKFITDTRLTEEQHQKIKEAVETLEVAQAKIDKVWKEIIRPEALSCSTIPELQELMNEITVAHNLSSSPFHVEWCFQIDRIKNN